MFAFLNGSGTCLLAWGLLPEASRARFSWVGWFVAAAPLTIVVALGSLVLLRIMFPPEPVAQLPMQRVRALQMAMLGPCRGARLGTIVVLVLTVAGWVAAPWLGLDLATIALLGLLATVALGIFDRPALQSLDWSFLVFFGVVLTIGRLSVTVGLDRVAAASVDRLLGSAPPGPLLFVLAVAGISLLIRLALDQDLTVVLVGVTLLPVAPRVGVDPWIVVISAAGDVGRVVPAFADAELPRGPVGIGEPALLPRPGAALRVRLHCAGPGRTDRVRPVLAAPGPALMAAPYGLGLIRRFAKPGRHCPGDGWSAKSNTDTWEERRCKVRARVMGVVVSSLLMVSTLAIAQDGHCGSAC